MIADYHTNGAGLELMVNYAFSGLNLSSLSSLKDYFYKVVLLLDKYFS